MFTTKNQMLELNSNCRDLSFRTGTPGEIYSYRIVRDCGKISNSWI